MPIQHFGIFSKPFKTASKKAYSDMARHTLRIDADDKTKTALKSLVKSSFQTWQKTTLEQTAKIRYITHAT